MSMRAFPFRTISQASSTNSARALQVLLTMRKAGPFRSQHAGGVDLFAVNYTYGNIGAIGVTNPLGALEIHRLNALNGTAKEGNFQTLCSSCGIGTVGQVTTNYDVNGNIIQKLDGNGNTTAWTYDTTRNLETSRTDGVGTAQTTTTTTAWHPVFRLPVRISEPGRVTSYVYDGHGNLLSKTLTSASLTSTSSYTYNSAGEVLTATDPRGNRTVFAYDVWGNLARVTNALGQVTLFPSYDANGRPLTIQDPNSALTTFTYNFRGEVTSRTEAQWVTAFAYDAAGQLRRLTRPDHSYLAYGYDAAHRLVSVTDAAGDILVYTLDAAGNPVTEQIFDANKVLTRTHSRIYDAINRVKQDTAAARLATNYSYDKNNNITNIGEPAGPSVYRTFDSLNCLIQTTTSDGGGASFSYDLNSRVAAVTDPIGLVTKYAHDGLDNVTSIASPDTGVTTTIYDVAGNIATSTDARGKTTTYTYDALNRVVEQAFADGSATVLQYDQGANGIGRLTFMSDPSGTTAWVYNSHGQVTSKQQRVGGITLTTRLVYGSATGQLVSVIYPSGATVLPSYDSAGRVSAIAYQPPGSSSSIGLLSQITYQPFGAVMSWREGNGAFYQRSFDLDGRVSALSLPAGDNIALSYDALNRILSNAETGLAAKTYAYNGFGSLGAYSSGSATQTFIYANSGDRWLFQSNISSPLSFLYNYDSASDRLLSLTGSWNEAFTYDAAGNTLSHTSPSADYSFDYDARGRLAEAFVGAIGTSYQINGLGQRVGKTQGQVLFAYDEAGHLTGEYDGKGVATEETVWLGDLPVAVLAPAGPLYVAPDNLGAPHQITNARRPGRLVLGSRSLRRRRSDRLLHVQSAVSRAILRPRNQAEFQLFPRLRSEAGALYRKRSDRDGRRDQYLCVCGWEPGKLHRPARIVYWAAHSLLHGGGDNMGDCRRGVRVCIFFGIC